MNDEVYSDVAWDTQDKAVRFDADVEAEREAVNELLKSYYSEEGHAFLWGVWVALLWTSGRNERLPSYHIASYKEYKQKRWDEFKDNLADKLIEYGTRIKRSVF